MGHADRIVEALPALTEDEQARLRAFLTAIKAERQIKQLAHPTETEQRRREEIAAELAQWRIPLGAHRFDRDEANAR